MKGMKTRKSTQAAFAQPDNSWSRKRSVRIVIRIQIQTTKKKISRASSSASPRLMSARNKAASFRRLIGQAQSAVLFFRNLCAVPAGRIRSFRHRVEDGGDRGGEVEARDALAHRDREARVGAFEQLVAEAVALGAEGKDRAGGELAGCELLALGVDRDQRPPAVRQPFDSGHGQGEVQSGGAAQGLRVPGVVAAGGEHRR